MSSPIHESEDSPSLTLPLVILATLLACIAAFIYLSGAGDDLMTWAAQRLFKYEAKAEEKALENMAEGKVEGMLKGQFRFRFLFQFRGVK